MNLHTVSNLLHHDISTLPPSDYHFIREAARMYVESKKIVILSMEQKEKIAFMREDKSMKYSEISHVLKIKRNAIVRYCLVEGIGLPPKPREYKARYRNGVLVRPFTKEDDRRLMELEATGIRYAEIARKMGRTWTSVKQRLAMLARCEENNG